MDSLEDNVHEMETSAHEVTDSLHRFKLEYEDVKIHKRKILGKVVPYVVSNSRRIVNARNLRARLGISTAHRSVYHPRWIYKFNLRFKRRSQVIAVLARKVKR